MEVEIQEMRKKMEEKIQLKISYVKQKLQPTKEQLETTAATLAKAKEEVGLLLQEIRPTTIAGFQRKLENTE